jgi:hypothetical protein
MEPAHDQRSRQDEAGADVSLGTRSRAFRARTYKEGRSPPSGTGVPPVSDKVVAASVRKSYQTRAGRPCHSSSAFAFFPMLASFRPSSQEILCHSTAV